MVLLKVSQNTLHFKWNLVNYIEKATQIIISASNLNFKLQTSGQNYTLKTFKQNINFLLQSQTSIEGFILPSETSTWK